MNDDHLAPSDEEYVKLVSGWSYPDAYELTRLLEEQGMLGVVREDGHATIAAVWCPASQVEAAIAWMDDEETQAFEMISEQELARQALAAVGEELTDFEPSPDPLPDNSENSRFGTFAYLSILIPFFVFPAWFIYLRSRKMRTQKIDSHWSKDQDLLVLLFATGAWGFVIMIYILSIVFEILRALR